MPNLRSNTHAQEAYDDIVKRKARQEAEDEELKKLGEGWVRRREEDLRQGKDSVAARSGCKLSFASSVATMSMD